jgi:hypothetical protein
MSSSAGSTLYFPHLAQRVGSLLGSPESEGRTEGETVLTGVLDPCGS